MCKSEVMLAIILKSRKKKFQFSLLGHIFFKRTTGTRSNDSTHSNDDNMCIYFLQVNINPQYKQDELEYALNKVCLIFAKKYLQELFTSFNSLVLTAKISLSVPLSFLHVKIYK